MFSKEEIEALIRDYIAENLSISVEVSRGGYWDDSPSIKVSVFLDGELVSDSSDSLPNPKISY